MAVSCKGRNLIALFIHTELSEDKGFISDGSVTAFSFLLVLCLCIVHSFRGHSGAQLLLSTITGWPAMNQRC